AEAEMQRLNRALQMLSACNEKLIRSSDENTLLRQICAICVNTGGYRMAWVGYAQRDAGSSLRPVADFGDDGYLRRMALSWSADKPSGKGPGGRTIREGKPVVVEDVENDASFAPWRAEALAMGYRGVICLPLRDGAETFGLLGLYAHEVRTVSADELRLLQEMADDLAFGILGLRTRREQQRLQSAIFNIATSVSTRSGKSFFRDLLLTATATLEASVGVIATLDLRHELCVRPICSVRDGVQIESASFSIHGTPCMESLSTQGRWIEGQLTALYPEARALHEYDPNACAYAGLPLLDSEGRPLGVVFLLFRNAPGSSDFVVSTLKIFAARIAAELERQQAESQLREQASLLDKAHDAILVRDLEHRILFWNRGAERLYGWSAAEASGRAIDELLYEDTRAFKEGTRKVLQQGEWQGELMQRDKQGRQIWIEAHWSLVRDEAGQPRSILAINTDITQRKASEREIYTLAFHDGLTGLPNRQLFRNRLEQALLVAERSREIGAVLFLDLDNFKALNDTQGHDVGDQLLVQTAARISHCLRESDTVARIGGDEFVVLLTDLGAQRSDAASAAQEIAEKIAHAFAEVFDLSGYEYGTSPSIGVVLFSDAESGVDELLKRADLAMYQAKAAGRNAIRFFDPDMQAAVTLRVQVEKDLRHALVNNEFVLYYQAQIDADGRLLGAEALIRWQHPQHGLLSPFSFIPIAEDCGLILSIGAWALDTACAQLAAWAHLPGRGGMSIAVNVSARQFRHPGFVVEVQDAIERHRIDARRLKLELTETQLLDNVEETIDKMQALGQLGVKLSLDDFGTGYSSLSYLRRLPLHQLKIDPSFVRDIVANPGDAAIARTIIALGQSLGLEVIAEGVETEAQRELLLGLGCECYQGYLFSRPIPIEQFEELEFIPADALR
ncbi:MAG TPA: EAL domain-containing protein, partial [Rhodocyclaceae bacterium]|nr:EAL domain-containing protein [Rhodocyclaceae bacterium]